MPEKVNIKEEKKKIEKEAAAENLKAKEKMQEKIKEEGAIDWDPIRTDYIVNNMTQKALAEKYGVAVNAIKKRKETECWFAARKEYLEKVRKKTIEKASSKTASKLARLSTVADKMIAVLEKTVADDEQFNRFLTNNRQRDGDTGDDRMWTEEEIFEKFDTQAMRNYATTIASLSETIRNLDNIYTPSEEWKMAYEKEKFEMEKQRFEMEKKRFEEERSEDNKTVIIQLKGDLEQYAK